MQRKILLLSLALVVLSGVALATDNDVTLSMHGLVATGNSSNYTIELYDVPLVAPGNSSNYTHNESVYAYAAEPYVAPSSPPDDDDDDGPGGSRTGDFYWPTTVEESADEEVPDRLFTTYASSANNSLRVESPRDDIALSSFSASLVEDKQHVRIRVVEEGNPELRNELQSFTGRTYCLFEVTHEEVDDEEIMSAMLSFKVNKSWVERQSATRHDVVLYRFVKWVWEDLVTTYEEQDEDYYYYEASSPGLSVFMVGIEEALPPANESVNVSSPPVTGDVVVETPPSDGDEPAWQESLPMFDRVWQLPWWAWMIVVVVIGGIVVGVVFAKRGRGVA
ncbi:PGF-pre-PGF domain-containing protein, partial [Candidatus Woesearchaeota archaeon]|nr:PGF-pre-PGF domain-containing protein [Candidatus Woesearchaeota archaeon]